MKMIEHLSYNLRKKLNVFNTCDADKMVESMRKLKIYQYYHILSISLFSESTHK